MTTSLLLILLATSPFATSSECNAHFDGDGIEWDGPEVCAASQSRFLQTTDFIKAVPATIQVEMLYNATGSDTTEIDLLLTNTGSGVEVVEFIDLGRDLNVMELQQSTSAVPELSPLVNRPSRVAATEGFTRGQDRDGSSSRRIILDTTGHDFAEVTKLTEQMSTPFTRMVFLSNLDLAILEAADAVDAPGVVEELTALGFMVELDVPLRLTADSPRWTEHAPGGGYVQSVNTSSQWTVIDMGMKDILRTMGAFRVDESSKIIVALLDSGVDFEHPSLEGSIAINAAEREGKAEVDDDDNGFIDDVRGWNFVSDDGNVMDNIGHGTHCAGLIAANGKSGLIGTGLSYARVLPLKIFDIGNGGVGRLSDALRAVDYAISRGSRVSSIGWIAETYSEIFRQAVLRAQNYDHIFVASAGNSGIDLDDVGGSYPCGFAAPNVLCIGAHGPDRNLTPTSNFGRVVDVSAPGEFVVSSSIDGGSDTMAGTSVAAAQVAGVAAMLIGVRRPFPLYFDEVSAAIITSTQPCAGTAFGCVDVGRVLEAVTGKNILSKALYVATGHPRKAISRIRLRPHQSKALAVVLSGMPAPIGYKEYDIQGTIGGGLVAISIGVRSSGHSSTDDDGVKCEASNNGTVDFGRVMVGQESGAEFVLHNGGDVEVLVDPNRLLGWAPLLRVDHPTSAVPLSVGDSVKIIITYVARKVGHQRFRMDSLAAGCDPIEVVADTVPNPLVVHEGSTVISVPAGSRSIATLVNITNPSKHTIHRASLRPRGRFYIFEAISVEDVEFPLTSLGGGWRPDMDSAATEVDCDAQQPTVVELNRTAIFDGEEVKRFGIFCNGLVMVSPSQYLPRIDSSSRFVAAYWVPTERAICMAERGCRVSFLVTVDCLIVEWKGLHGSTTAVNVEVQMHLHYDGRLTLLYPEQHEAYSSDGAVVGIGHSHFAALVNVTGSVVLLWTPRLQATPVEVLPETTECINATLNLRPFGANSSYDGSCGSDLGCIEESSTEAVWSDSIDIISWGASASHYYHVDIYGTELLYSDVVDESGMLSSDGGHTVVEVLALDQLGRVNTAEDGLLITVSMLIGVEVFYSENTLLRAGRASVNVEVPAGRAPVSVVAEAAHEVEIPFDVVNCGGNDVTGDNGLRYLLWNPSDDRLICAIRNGSSWSTVRKAGELGDDVWISVMTAAGQGRVVVPSDRIPRRSGMVVLGQESNAIGSGNCEGFCVFGGPLSLNMWKYMKRPVEKVIRELLTTSTEDPRDKLPPPETPTRTAITLTGVTTTTTTTTTTATWWNMSTTSVGSTELWTTTEALVTTATTAPLTPTSTTSTTTMWSDVGAPTTAVMTTTANEILETTTTPTSSTSSAFSVYGTTTTVDNTGNGTRRLRESDNEGGQGEESSIEASSAKTISYGGFQALMVATIIFVGFSILCVRCMRRKVSHDKQHPLAHTQEQE